ncbi:Bcr/CflA family drug resistance efflux transporter [Gilliamella apicola]|uniref:Bcr/CflA family efflux transporter n=3 Tax=Gilliamella apicola TaxID=1196095 RepID=A0A242NFQ8_9GAMM|nr:Bcr/CflA family drug resistance efflux transporter [Gilliamella apicola]OTP86586.1 Bcr/CflA family drug resistance efflux transporter [Gilliamella apicola]OTP91747.1 Bcr/CflA family drug resistance efflux transporter [Gilliamella apicola]OTP98674.1 Bcr/CflA family drug resistance efflux transporter [Gilliamella apicola]OTQ10337.1 Bcr/CflA family drug resistance efflux transporter [Gilliamella apicola]
MLMPLSIDMYLPSMPTIAQDFNVADATVQLTISCYLLGFSFGQLLFGPITDSYGRRYVLIAGLIIFIVAALICGIASNINQLITARFFHGIAAAATSIVINALMKDIYRDRDEFSKMMSFVMLISNVAPLLAPIIGGFILYWFNWQANFYTISLTALIGLALVIIFIPETLSKAKRSKFSFTRILSNFIMLFRHGQVLAYMMIGAFAGAGLFSFLSLGPFVYMNLHGVASTHFGYYFALNIVVMVFMNTLNSRLVKHVGSFKMMQLGLFIQFVMAIGLMIVTLFNLGFIYLVICIAGYIGCMSTIGGNSMAIILDFYPHIAGTASSLAGTIRFAVAGAVGISLSFLVSNLTTVTTVSDNSSEWLMTGSMVLCNFLAVGLFLKIRKIKRK